MDNALIFTGLLVLAALAGGYFGAACAKGRKAGDCEGRLAEVEERLREVEFLIGDTPTGGLLGRVGALEEAARKEGADGR